METQLNNTTERRRFQRMESNLPVKYRNLKMAATPLGSLTKDIGEGGIRFNTSEFISLACRLVVEINIPTIQRPIKAISKVAWIKRTPASDQYELGNQFLEISKEDKAAITDYVNRLSNPSL